MSDPDFVAKQQKQYADEQAAEAARVAALGAQPYPRLMASGGGYEDVSTGLVYETQIWQWDTQAEAEAAVADAHANGLYVVPGSLVEGNGGWNARIQTPGTTPTNASDN